MSEAIPFSPSTNTEYSYLVEDILRQAVIGKLPLQGVEYEDYLRQAGTLRGHLSRKDADANTELLAEGQVAIYALRNGKVEFGGRLLTTRMDPESSDVVQVEVDGWLAYFDERDIWIDRSFTDTEQFEIFEQLVTDAQTGTDADLGITVEYAAASGVKRDRKEEYRYFSGKNLGEALRQLSAVENGFEYGISYLVSADQISKTITLYYPEMGRDYSNQPGFEFKSQIGFDFRAGIPSNILRHGVLRDASNLAWRIRGWGTGSDESRLMSERIDATFQGKYPYLDGQANLSSDTQQTSLDDGTVRELKKRAKVVRLPSLIVNANAYPLWESYGLGDKFRVRIDDGAYSSLEGVFRIVGYKMDTTKDEPTIYVEEL